MQKLEIDVLFYCVLVVQFFFNAFSAQMGNALCAHTHLIQVYKMTASVWANMLTEVHVLAALFRHLTRKYVPTTCKIAIEQWRI